MMMTTLDFYEAAVKAVREGKMAESVLDEAVRQVVAAMTEELEKDE